MQKYFLEKSITKIYGKNLWQKFMAKIYILFNILIFFIFKTKTFINYNKNKKWRKTESNKL